MTVDPATAEAAGLVTEHDGVTYYFCGRGCLLDFRDDPDRYLDPSYEPRM
jgi:Cu+-exporting ATPase